MEKYWNFVKCFCKILSENKSYYLLLHLVRTKIFDTKFPRRSFLLCDMNNDDKARTRNKIKATSFCVPKEDSKVVCIMLEFELCRDVFLFLL